MKSWSLKAKFGFFASALATLSLLAGASVMVPTVFHRQQGELDRQIQEEADELFRDLANFRGAPINPRHPLSAKFLPVSMHDRLLRLSGPEGQLLYESPALQGQPLSSLAQGFETIHFQNRELRVGVFAQAPFTLQLGADLAPMQELRATIWIGLAAAAPIAAAIVFLGGFLLGKFAVRPIADLARAAERINVQQLHERLPTPSSKDEIYRLSLVLNDAFDRLKHSYEAAARFSADASHQLKTPLAVLRIALEEFRLREDTTPALRQEIEALLQQTRRLNALINDLLLLAQADAGRLQLEPQSLDLAPLLLAAFDDLETLVEGKQITLEAHVQPNISVTADRRRLRLALQVLVENAAKYTPAGGSIRLDAAIEDHHVLISLGNSGAPIPPQDRTRIFERFRRGSTIGENLPGFGLGLNLAQTLLAAHGGDLRLADTNGDWVEFQIRIPTHQA